MYRSISTHTSFYRAASSNLSRPSHARCISTQVSSGLGALSFSQGGHGSATNNSRCSSIFMMSSSNSLSQSWHQLRNFHSSSNFAGRRFYHGTSAAADKDDNSSSNLSPLAFSGSSSTGRPQMRIGDLLKGLEHRNFAVTEDCSVEDAVAHLVKEKLGSALVTNDSGAVLGIFTARDLLKFINDKSPHSPNYLVHMNAAQGSHSNLHDLLHHTKITDIMTKREKLVYCSPKDSVKHCREIMFQLKIRNLPVLDGNHIRGIVTMKLLADAYFNAADVGGKKSYMSNVIGRKGIPDTAKVSMTNSSNSSGINGSSGGVMGEYINISSSATNPGFLDLEVGAYALPHPFKHPQGVAIDRRGYGAFDLAMDVSLSEDAHFAVRVTDPLFLACPTPLSNSSSSASSSTGNEDVFLPVSVPKRESQVYLCVADGVGSWRQFGVDPREYPVTLVDNARRVIEADFSHRALMGNSPFDRDLDPIHPLDVMMDAWNVTTSEGIMGSSTFCIATLDKKLNQLHYSNVGDCGLIVLRRMEDAAEGTAGYYNNNNLNTSNRGARHGRTPWKVAYLSQQQMKSFNLPYQLGNNPRVKNQTNPLANKAAVDSGKPLSPEEARKRKEEEEFWMYAPRVFETPSDADTASIPIMAGDILVLSTDGLFDNMDLDDVITVVSQWEAKHFPGANGVLDSSYQGHGAMQPLAQAMVEAARNFSLDSSRDGPFALLAKENDILWSGGMPDDTTVIVARVVKDTGSS